MPDRFYAPTSYENGTVRLSGPEAHHLRDVMRLRIGQQVVLFDGEGGEADAEIVSFGKELVDLKLGAVRYDVPTGRPSIVLATAVPKGERFRWLIEKGVELGVDRLIALNTSRSVVDPRETKLEKMRSVVISACKQSGRNTLMRIEGTISWNELVSSTRESQCRLLVADPSGEPIADVLAKPQSDDASDTKEIVLAVGPEGGFVESELTVAREAGGEIVSLGANILRMETAALAMVAYVQFASTSSP